MNSENSSIDKLSSLITNSVTVKLLVITILMLMLLIPAFMIEEIIQSREQINHNVTNEVSDKWANSQQLNGPILTIPLIYENFEEGKKLTSIKYWHFLPDNLIIDGQVIPEKLKRGIYDVIVYNSTLDVSGSFNVLQNPDPQDLKEIQYEQAFITIGISDLRGIKNEINLNWNEEKLDVIPGSRIPEIIYSGITVNIPNLSEILNENLSFNFSLDLQGSKNLSFIPVGSSTKVDLKSPWTSPSFNGNFLPDTRQINDDGFTASWSVLELNRNFPQIWVGNSNSKQMQESIFGVDLILPIDDYQKALRSVKYVVMTISLTFLIFFLVEVLNKRKIHPFQYALVGLALCLFYILLVSISEHSNFNLAFGISTSAIVLMISTYSLAIFKKLNLSAVLFIALIAIYGFLFITLQLADYALLMGSIGLTLILGLTMYFTRNINWYSLNLESNQIDKVIQ